MDLTHVRFCGTTRGKCVPARVTASITGQAEDPAIDPAPPPVGPLPAFVLELDGLDATHDREAPLKRRTSACLRTLRVESERAALECLAARPELAGVALNALLIGVSEFFRDPMVFRSLQTTIIPVLQRRRRPLRILSVGCSSGAELYSVAMLLAESGLLERAYLLGIDCRADAVAMAKSGVFADAPLATLDECMRSRYLERAAGGWRLVESVRQHTDWRVLDATRECPPGPWDLVLCRNLFIYVQSRVAEAMLVRIMEQLVPGGFLVVGKAERPPSRLNLIEVGRCVYQTHGT